MTLSPSLFSQKSSIIDVRLDSKYNFGINNHTPATFHRIFAYPPTMNVICSHNNLFLYL